MEVQPLSSSWFQARLFSFLHFSVCNTFPFASLTSHVRKEKGLCISRNWSLAHFDRKSCSEDLMFPLMYHGHPQPPALWCFALWVRCKIFPQSGRNLPQKPPCCLLEAWGWHFAVLCCGSPTLKPLDVLSFTLSWLPSYLMCCSSLGCDKEWNLIHSRIISIIELATCEGAQVSYLCSHTSFPILCYLILGSSVTTVSAFFIVFKFVSADPV